VKILVLIGSLRAEAFSRKLANALPAFAPEGTSFAFTDGRELPLYDQDLDGEEKPPPVRALLDAVGDADGLVFVSPEFNYGVPGPLKNLIDWASRPAYRSPLRDKPSLVITHSIAPTGGAHAQLSSILGGTATPVFHAPSLTFGAVHEAFDESGAVTNELMQIRLTKVLVDYAAWAEKLSG
jgi:chromate reductase